MYRWGIYMFIMSLFFFNGCSRDSVDNTVSPVSITMSKTEVFSGETQIATISLTENAMTGALTGVISQSALDDESYIISIHSSDEDVLSIFPNQCELDVTNPSCEVQLTSTLSHTDTASVDTEITIKHNNTEHYLTTVTSIANGEKKRSLFVNNQCSFDVWLEPIGASAAQIGCSPQTGTDYQSDCPQNQLCLFFSEIKSYCVNANVIDVNTTAPIQAADLNTTYELNASACSGGIVSESSSPIFGQCVCSSDSDCELGQKCKLSAGTNQCSWDLSLDDFGKVEKKSSINIPLEYKEDSKFAASGSMYIKLGCNESGAKCMSDNKDAALNSPTTFIEYTLATKDVDFYDVSNINGATVPVSIKPIVSTNTPMFSRDDNGSQSFAGNPYWCSVAAGTAQEFETQIQKIILAHPGTAPDPSFAQDYGCENEYNTTLAPGFTLVIPDGEGATYCSSNNDCVNASQGKSCGITSNVMMNNLDGNNTQYENFDRSEHYECGHIIGYASLTQLCGLAEANASYGYIDSALGVECSTKTTESIDFTNYAICSMHFVSPDDNDTGAARSCFNSNQTASGDTCCGYSTWDGMPSSESKDGASSAVSGVNTDKWTTKIEKFVKPMKDGCQTAYSYQYDDLYSTFVCQSKDTEDKNYLSYQVTLCDGGDTGGISVPRLKECSLNSGYINIDEGLNSILSTPPAYPDENNASIVHPYDIAVYGCSTAEACSDTNLSKYTVAPPAPAQVENNVYGDANASYYYVLGRDPRNDTYQGCMFQATKDECLAHVDSNYSSIGCEAWTILESSDSVFSNRTVSMPAFTNGSSTNPFVYNPF